MSDKNSIFNEISYVIEIHVKLDVPNLNLKIKGFSNSDFNDNKDNKNQLVLREYKNGNIYVFDNLFNSATYTRKEALDILGPCFLTTAIDYLKIKDINLQETDQYKIKKLLIFGIPVWKSSDSRYFLLANNSKQK